MMEFGGWWMPVQYKGILDEHKAVRSAAGLFDISHMGQIFVSGGDAGAWLNSILTNDVSLLQDAQGQYTLLLNEQGGVIDDLIIYRIEPDSYLLVVNASMIETDFQWLRSKTSGKITILNQSEQWAGLALQGPAAEGILARLLGDQIQLPARNGLLSLSIANGPVLIARTGYTGEDGFEWFCPASVAALWWDKILEAGRPVGILPCGLGARDTLRLEAGFPLNGADLSPTHSPLEAGLSFFVKFDKGNFIGRAALDAQRSGGLERKLVALLMGDKSPPPRPHYAVFHAETPVGETTSGSLSPSLGAGLAMAYLPAHIATLGTLVEVEIRGRRFPATVAKRPLYRRQKTSGAH
ncbi:MAG: aminomethyltransferase [Verrucomicrobia bacterium]|nr:MAG: aminomethyltransferase [Verrucomicrobiota bacterium]